MKSLRHGLLNVVLRHDMNAIPIMRIKPKTKARILKALANVKRVKEEMAEDEEEADIKKIGKLNHCFAC